MRSEHIRKNDPKKAVNSREKKYIYKNKVVKITEKCINVYFQEKKAVNVILTTKS